MPRQSILSWAFLVPLFIIISCKKEDEGETFSGNQAPYYSEVSTLAIQHYVNRLFIDLIGREPLDTEMDEEVKRLRTGNLGMESRDSLIDRLQNDASFLPGDSSYRSAYYQRVYELAKTRLLEGASDALIQREVNMIKNTIFRDSLEGNWLGVSINQERLSNLDKVLAIKTDYQNGQISINELFGRLLNNDVYDEINMNTFNFVRASFNDLFLRFPTETEFNRSFEMIENNAPTILMGKSGQNKNDYIEILINTPEFHEGIIIWMYQTLLSREPTSKETFDLIENFMITANMQEVQKAILKTDEYANF